MGEPLAGVVAARADCGWRGCRYLLSIMVQAAAAQMFEEQDTGYVRAIRDVLLFLPFATLAKAMQDLGEASDNDSDTGMKWSERDGCVAGC